MMFVYSTCGERTSIGPTTTLMVSPISNEKSDPWRPRCSWYDTAAGVAYCVTRVRRRKPPLPTSPGTISMSSGPSRSGELKDTSSLRTTAEPMVTMPWTSYL